MAQKFPDSPKKRLPKFSGCFPACFRSSKSTEKAGKKGSWLISWSTKSPKKALVEEKIVIKKKDSFRVVKLGKKISSSNPDRGSPVNSSAPPGQAPAAAGGDEVVHRQPDKTREEKNQEEMFPVNSKSLNPTNKENKGVILRRNSSLPAADKIGPILSHSASMPPSTVAGNQPAAAVIGGAHEREIGASEELIGMSIIAVTLLIMVIWGKVFAVLCTSAWLYFYPNILKATKLDQPKRTKSQDFDDKSEAKKLKKKVVFDGFLERSHRG